MGKSACHTSLRSWIQIPKSHVKPDVEVLICTSTEVVGGDEKPGKLTYDIFRKTAKNNPSHVCCDMWAYRYTYTRLTIEREIKIKNLDIPSLVSIRLMSSWNYNYTVHLQSSHRLYSSDIVQKSGIKIFVVEANSVVIPCKIRRKIIYLGSMVQNKQFHSQRKK